MFKNITIKGLRGLNDCTLEDFKKINLIVGKNNCGKTTLLESLFVLSNPSNPELPLRINGLRNISFGRPTNLIEIEDNGLYTLFDYQAEEKSIFLQAGLVSPQETRQLTIKPINQRRTTTINETTQSFVYSKDLQRIDGLDCEYTFQSEQFPQKTTTHARIVMKNNGIEIESPPSPSEIFGGVYLSANFHPHISQSFHHIQVQKRVHEVIEVLQTIEPNLISLSLGVNGILLADVGYHQLIPLNMMGGGLIKVLAVILAVMDNKNNIVLIDEIENGLYRTSQQILWKALLKIVQSFHVQVFAVTHSMECIQALDAAYREISDIEDDIRLYRMERDHQKIRVIHYDATLLSAAIAENWEVR